MHNVCFWQPIGKPKEKFIENYAFFKNATYIQTNFQMKKGPLVNLSGWKSTLSGPHIPVPTFPLSIPPPPPVTTKLWNMEVEISYAQGQHVLSNTRRAPGEAKDPTNIWAQSTV